MPGVSVVLHWPLRACGAHRLGAEYFVEDSLRLGSAGGAFLVGSDFIRCPAGG